VSLSSLCTPVSISDLCVRRKPHTSLMKWLFLAVRWVGLAANMCVFSTSLSTSFYSPSQNRAALFSSAVLTSEEHSACLYPATASSSSYHKYVGRPFSSHHALTLPLIGYLLTIHNRTHGGHNGSPWYVSFTTTFSVHLRLKWGSLSVRVVLLLPSARHCPSRPLLRRGNHHGRIRFPYYPPCQIQ
jgi:hypothetical protein